MSTFWSFCFTALVSGVCCCAADMEQKVLNDHTKPENPTMCVDGFGGWMRVSLLFIDNGLFVVVFRSAFVMENLLFYTTLLQDVLPRFFRLDLAMPKNAYMLFRLSKVLNLPRLSAMIREGETIWKTIQSF